MYFIQMSQRNNRRLVFVVEIISFKDQLIDMWRINK